MINFFFFLSLLSLVVISQRLHFVPIFSLYFVVFSFGRKSWENKKRLSRPYSASWFEIALWAVSHILRLFYDFLFSLILLRVYGISWAMLPNVSLHCSSQWAMLLFVLLVWRLYFAADTYILSPHNSTTWWLIVGLMKVIPLCRRYTGTLFLFSVFLASLTEVIPVLRKFHFAAWISLILCTIIFFFCFCQRVKNLKFWSSMSSLLLPPSSLFFSPRACQVFLSFCFRWRRVYSLPKTYSFCLLFLKKRKYFLVFSMLLSI